MTDLQLHCAVGIVYLNSVPHASQQHTHTSHVTRHMSHVTRHTSHVTHHMSTALSTKLRKWLPPVIFSHVRHT